METLIERLARKAGPPVRELTVLPVVRKEHEGSCGDGCGCAGDEGGCCGS